MVKFAGQNLTVRVWVTADQNFNVDTQGLESLIKNYSTTESTLENMRSLIQQIESLDNIAAAEVLDSNGNGILLYPDWN
jgi:hypothetical protein